MIIWLASYPRSGNTFARIVLRFLFGIQTATVYPTAVVEQERELRDLMQEKSINSLDEAIGAPERYIIKTHELPSGDLHPALYLVRDGRDALVSYAHFLLHTHYGIPSGPSPEAFRAVLRRLILTNHQFGGWGPHVLAWKGRAAPTKIVRYEDLIENPERVLHQAFTALGLQYPPPGGQVPSFQYLHGKFPFFFRKGKAGSWRAEMPESLQILFWKRYGDAMAALNYPSGGATGLLESPVQLETPAMPGQTAVASLLREDLARIAVQRMAAMRPWRRRTRTNSSGFGGLVRVDSLSKLRYSGQNIYHGAEASRGTSARRTRGQRPAATDSCTACITSQAFRRWRR